MSAAFPSANSTTSASPLAISVGTKQIGPRHRRAAQRAPAADRAAGAGGRTRRAVTRLPADTLDDLFRLAAPRLSGQIGPDGIARLRLARRPALGHLEVDANLDGSTLWLKPRGLVLRRRRCAYRSARLPTACTTRTASRACADRHQLRAWRAVP